MGHGVAAVSENRDQLAEVLAAAVAMGDIRVNLTQIQGSIETLTTEVRLQHGYLVKGQEEAAAEIDELKVRVGAVETWRWKVAGAATIVGAVAGVGGSALLG